MQSKGVAIEAGTTTSSWPSTSKPAIAKKHSHVAVGTGTFDIDASATPYAHDAGAGFLGMLRDFRKGVPGITPITLTASVLFYVPGVRDLSCWLGFRQVNTEYRGCGHSNGGLSPALRGYLPFLSNLRALPVQLAGLLTCEWGWTPIKLAGLLACEWGWMPLKLAGLLACEWSWMLGACDGDVGDLPFWLGRLSGPADFADQRSRC